MDLAARIAKLNADLELLVKDLESAGPIIASLVDFVGKAEGLVAKAQAFVLPVKK